MARDQRERVPPVQEPPQQCTGGCRDRQETSEILVIAGRRYIDRSRRHRGVVCDPEWGKQFIVQSVKMHRDVVPLHFSGCNSDFFYRLANLRAALKLKLNIEMMYLADEMMKNRGKTFTLTIGKPIPWHTFDSSRRPKEWSQYVKDIVYKL